MIIIIAVLRLHFSIYGPISFRTWSPRAAREETTEPEYDRPLVLLHDLQ